jgi:IS1 family transposase
MLENWRLALSPIVKKRRWTSNGDKSNQRWIGYAVKHSTNTVLAYERNIPIGEHEVGENNTQKIKRKNLNLSTGVKRLTRKTIYFSKCEKTHDIVIGLLINKVEFEVNIYA